MTQFLQDPYGDDAMKFKVKKNSAGEWYWNLIAGNGQVVATAGESFSTNVKTNAGTATIEVEDANAVLNVAIRRLAQQSR
jgi:uncharacterized protein YegP (UPF0339 family)